ncbi:MAG: hypothetical protein AAF197_12205 [Pseudomonadota bacterium]
MNKKYLIPQILLTIAAMEFFGPAIRDTGHSHLLNVEWVGHARLHLAWLLGFMVTSGVANLYFIWRSSNDKHHDLNISLIWQGCNLLGFWIATIFVNQYGGAIIDPNHHVSIFGLDENVVGFTFLTAIYLAAFYLVKYRILNQD